MAISEERAAVLGKNLSDIMYDRHVSQAKLATDLKFPKTTVSSWMNSRRIPRAGAMDALCRYLNCTREDLLRLPGEPKKEFKPLPQDTPQAAQEPLREPKAGDLKYVWDALDEAGYGHLRGIVEAAAGADESCYDFVIGILKRNPKKN